VSIETLRITATAHDNMIMWCLATIPDEACGILSATNDEPDLGRRVIPLANVSETPTIHYEMDPYRQVRTTHRLDARGERIAAVYHSHVESPALLSIRDFNEARDLDPVYIVVGLKDRAAPDVRAFRIYMAFVGVKAFSRVHLEVVDGR
jgi:[CysO sulfur-carrier protein]-S-L-cysteine hydrolase